MNAKRIIERAARRAPAELAERLEEEWLADLAGRRGRFAQLRFALGCCWATRVIARDFSLANVAAAGAATGDKVMTAYAQPEAPAFSRRTMIFVLILGLHAFLIYGLQAGLTKRLINVLPENMKVILIKDQPRVVPIPPPTSPDFMKPKMESFQKPDVDFGVDSEQTIQPVQPVVDPTPIPTQPPRAVTRLIGGPGKGFPSTDDYYPSASRRMGEQGITGVLVCVDASGKLMQEPSIAQTSGSARLDEGALKLAKAGSGHYRPSSEDGRPISSCFAYRIKYVLTD